MKLKKLVLVISAAVMLAFVFSACSQSTQKSADAETETEMIVEKGDQTEKCGGDSESKCGEGKCGEGKEDSDTTKKCGEGKCGEGKCGEGDEKKEDKKCGEGKCGA